MRYISILSLALTLVIVACVPGAEQPFTTTTMVSTSISPPEIGPSPTATRLPVQESSSTPDLAATATPIESGWQTYTDPAGQFSVSVPAGWQEGENGSYQGVNGFFRTGYLPEMAYMDRTYRVCERLANEGGDPGRAVQWTAVQQADACVMTPMGQLSTNEVQVVIENPAGDPEQRYFYLESDAEQIQAILSTLTLLNPVAERNPFPYPTGPLRPEDQAFWEKTAMMPRELTLEEHAIVSASVDSPTHVEFNERISEEILEKRAAWREPTLQGRLEQTNTVLATFGYGLQPSPEASDFEIYKLYQGEEVLQEDIPSLWPVATSQSGADFALVVEVLNDGYRLVQKDGVTDWDMSASLFTAPIFYGEDLLSIRWEPESGQVEVWQGEETVFSFVAAFLVSSPVQGLWSWNGHWLLEVDGFLIQDGKTLNELLDYEDIFGWQLLDGKPFYYFRRGPRIGLSHNDLVLPVYYDEVVHNRCCEPGAFNAAGNESMAWFYGLRDGTWYYVEIGKYKE